jgi:hypothetical protein
MSPVRFQFVVTMALPPTNEFTSQRKMRIVSLVVGLVLLVCLAADAVESSSTVVTSAKKESHSSGTGGYQQHRHLRSRRVQSSQPASTNNNEPPQPLGSPGTLGILPGEDPENQNASTQGEASVEELTTLTSPGESGAQGAQEEATQSMGETLLVAASPNVPASFERQEENGGQNNNPADAYGSESAPGLGIDPSVLQSGILGVLPVTIPENQNVSDQVDTPVVESENADTPSETHTGRISNRRHLLPCTSPTFSTPPETQEGANSDSICGERRSNR